MLQKQTSSGTFLSQHTNTHSDDTPQQQWPPDYREKYVSKRLQTRTLYKLRFTKVCSNFGVTFEAHASIYTQIQSNLTFVNYNLSRIDQFQLYELDNFLFQKAPLHTNS